jgi:hypothetical protein
MKHLDNLSTNPQDVPCIDLFMVCKCFYFFVDFMNQENYKEKPWIWKMVMGMNGSLTRRCI